MSLKKKLVMALVTTTAGATIMAAGSFALFTSSATNAGNTFTAGTVVITDKTVGTLSSQELNAANLAPGDSKVLKMTVKNEGSLDEWVKIDNEATQATRTGALFNGNYATIITNDTSIVRLAPGDSKVFDVTYNMPLAADNTYKATTGSFGVVVDAVQARNNTNQAADGPTSWQ